MNTIPLIFNERQIKRTVLGGKAASVSQMSVQADTGQYKPHDTPPPIAVVLLNRSGNHFCVQNLDTLLRCGFREIIIVENSNLSYSVEEVVRRYPQVKFVVPFEALTCGDMINIGIAEIDSPFALVIWDDLKISAPFLSPRTVETVVSSGCLCTVPLLQSASLQLLPVRMNPHIEKNTFSAVPAAFSAGSVHTVYPFDFIGIYDKQKFMQLGGYDYTITSPYWQNLDFALRGWLWGEKIELCRLFRLTYDGETPSEDTTADYAQLRFFLKNCAPVFRSDYAYIPKSRYFDFAGRCPGGLFRSYGLFADARSWVRKNRYRFKTDIVSFTRDWVAGQTGEDKKPDGTRGERMPL